MPFLTFFCVSFFIVSVVLDLQNKNKIIYGCNIEINLRNMGNKWNKVTQHYKTIANTTKCSRVTENKKKNERNQNVYNKKKCLSITNYCNRLPHFMVFVDRGQTHTWHDAYSHTKRNQPKKSHIMIRDTWVTTSLALMTMTTTTKTTMAAQTVTGTCYFELNDLYPSTLFYLNRSHKRLTLFRW